MDGCVQPSRDAVCFHAPPLPSQGLLSSSVGGPAAHITLVTSSLSASSAPPSQPSAGGSEPLTRALTLTPCCSFFWVGVKKEKLSVSYIIGAIAVLHWLSLLPWLMPGAIRDHYITGVQKLAQGVRVFEWPCWMRGILPVPRSPTSVHPCPAVPCRAPHPLLLPVPRAT